VLAARLTRLPYSQHRITEYLLAGGYTQTRICWRSHSAILALRCTLCDAHGDVAVEVRGRKDKLGGRAMRQMGNGSCCYVQDATPGQEEVNYCDYGIGLTRRFRALKLWMSFKIFGIDAFRLAVARGIELAETAEHLLEASPNWQVITPAQLEVVTFSYRSRELTPAEISTHNRVLVERMIANGYALLSSTDLHGRTVLRMCTINPRTTEADLESTVHRLESLAAM